MEKMTKADKVLEMMSDLANNLNIDVTTTHNETDADYCTTRLNAMKDTASVMGLKTDIVYDNTGRVTSISVNNKTKTFP